MNSGCFNRRSILNSVILVSFFISLSIISSNAGLIFFVTLSILLKSMVLELLANSSVNSIMDATHAIIIFMTLLIIGLM